MIRNRVGAGWAVLTLLFAAATARYAFAWQNEFYVEKPFGWQEQSFWEGSAAVVKWQSPNRKAQIIIHKFGANSSYSTIDKFLESHLAKNKDGMPSQFIKKFEITGKKALLYERLYEELEIVHEAFDLPPKIKSRKTFREQFALVGFPGGLYVIRFGTRRWLWRWHRSEREKFWKNFKIL